MVWHKETEFCRMFFEAAERAREYRVIHQETWLHHPGRLASKRLSGERSWPLETRTPSQLIYSAMYRKYSEIVTTPSCEHRYVALYLALQDTVRLAPMI